MGVTERGNANAGDEVEIGAARLVVEADTLPALEDDWLPTIGLQQVLRLERLDVQRCHFHHFAPSRTVSASGWRWSVVPGAAFTPRAASSMRPSTIRTVLTPASSAALHDSSLATMPAVAVPDEITWSMPARSRSPI